MEDKKALKAIRSVLKDRNADDQQKVDRIVQAVLSARGAGGSSPFDGASRCPWCGCI